MVGRELAHYRLIEQIGEGGMGVVWKAQDTTLDREVAATMSHRIGLDALRIHGRR